jgi:hypothetical protein
LPVRVCAKAVEVLAHHVVELRAGEVVVGGVGARGSVDPRGRACRRCRPRGVEGDVVAREPAVHVDHLLLGHVEAPRELGAGGVDAQRREALLLLVEVEEELALRLRGAELHQAPVVEDEPQDVRADPPRRVGRQLHPAVGVVALHGLHEADVALLDEVHEVAVGAAVLVGDLHHQAEVGRHHARRGFDVARLA